MVNGVGPVFTTLTDEWGTPLKQFREWDKQFNFTLDPCGTIKRPLKDSIKTIDIRQGMNGLSVPWGGGARVL